MFPNNNKIILMLSLLLLQGGIAVHAVPDTGLTNRIIVKFKSPDKASATAAAMTAAPYRIQAAGDKLTLRHQRQLGGGAHVYRLPGQQSLRQAEALAAELMQRDDVEYAEPDALRRPYAVPTDPDYIKQWYLFEAAGGVNAEDGWDTTTGDAGVVIAVIDTGITNHSEITRKLDGYDFISENAPGDFFTANDGNGRDDDPSDPGDAVAADECGTDSLPSNSSWHGTFVSGLIMANTNNAAGIASVDHNAFLLPLRALGKCGGFTSDISDAIYWAAGLHVDGIDDNPNPADVINLSLGGQGACSTTEQNAIDAAVAAGSVVVAAAGNEGFATIAAPANCNNVIAVTATTRQGGETCYTNVGSEADISAPGGNLYDSSCFSASLDSNNIYSTTNTGTTSPVAEDYAYSAGTSFAAPLVSGAVALMRAVDNSLTPGSIEAKLKSNARPYPTGTTDSFGDCAGHCGEGILDIAAAVTAAGTGGEDSEPNAFAFIDRSGVERDALIESRLVTVGGIDIVAVVTVSGGEYSINGDAYTAIPGTAMNGDEIKVRVRSSADFSTREDVTLTVGGVSDTFSATTEDRDTVPEAFSFAGRTGVNRGTVITSDMITIIGINDAAAISIVGGEYSIDGGAYTDAGGTLINGARIRVRLTSSSSFSDKENATLTVGGVSGTFSVTTEDEPDSGSSGGGGGGGGGGSLSWLLLMGGFLLWRRSRYCSHPL